MARGGFLGLAPRTNDQIHPHERVEPVGRPEMSERKSRAWEHQPDLPDTRERGVACADPRCGLRWAAAPRDYEATFERHWRDSGSKHRGQPLPPVGEQYTLIDPRAKATAPAPPTPSLPAFDGWTITADPLDTNRVIYMCDRCRANGNLLRAQVGGFVADHDRQRHPA